MEQASGARVKWCVFTRGEEKRQRAAAVQDASRVISLPDMRKPLGLRQSAAAFGAGGILVNRIAAEHKFIYRAGDEYQLEGAIPGVAATAIAPIGGVAAAGGGNASQS